eukprot:TRINITY_DN71210_c0_g1_i1.p1 TRINITY_DN71210_c0_g1~~TRINITY_DN71210_c0_g1_i1.p1  ORF type:complete len:481 (+),score=103.87 TRINITY_DN71210_c0_g1_i1:124-1566(+)
MPPADKLEAPFGWSVASDAEHAAGEPGAGDSDSEGDYLVCVPSARAALRTPRHFEDPRHTCHGVSDAAALGMLLKAIVGSGVLFLPRAFADAGSVLSVCGEIVVAILTGLCVLLLVRARGGEPLSYEQIGLAAYGPGAAAAVNASVFLFQLGLVVMYFIFVADTVHTALIGATQCAPWAQFFTPDVVLVLVALVQMPVALVRSIGRLAWLAVVADVCIAIGLVVLLYTAGSIVAANGAAEVPAVRWHGAGLFVGTSVLAFEGIGVMLPIADSMQNPDHFPRIMLGATAASCVLYCAIGVMCILAFGAEVRPNVLLSVGAASGAALTVSLLYAAAVAATLPLQGFPAYIALESSIGLAQARGDTARVVSNAARIALVAVLAVCASLWRQQVHALVAIIGGLAGVPISFVYPAIFHYRLSTDRGEATPFTAARDIGIAVLGSIAAAYVTAVSVAEWLRPPLHSGHPAARAVCAATYAEAVLR